ncbi:MAG TPA: hypothetical protein VGO59_05460 [Verrucomicrobiae bacterium]|jgi:hypothetical protein
MKTLPKMEISEELDAQIGEGAEISNLHPAQDLPSRLAGILSLP